MSYPKGTPTAGEAANKSRRRYYHVPANKTLDHIETLCGRRIPRRTGVFGAEAESNRQPCPECVTLHRLNQDMKRAMSDEAALILGAFDLIGRNDKGVDQ